MILGQLMMSGMAVIMMQHCEQATNRPLPVICKAESVHDRLPGSEELWERLRPHDRDIQLSSKPELPIQASMKSSP